MNADVKHLKKLAERHWRDIGCRTMSIHGHVVAAFVAGYKQRQKEETGETDEVPKQGTVRCPRCGSTNYPRGIIPHCTSCGYVRGTLVTHTNLRDWVTKADLVIAPYDKHEIKRKKK